MNKLDVHYYDTKLGHIKVPETNEAFEKVVDEIIEEVKRLEYKNRIDVYKCLSLFLTDPVGNVDKTNNKDVEDILIVVWENCKNDDSMKLCLFEQLVDIINSGSCPQGRVIRLMQFIF